LLSFATVEGRGWYMVKVWARGGSNHSVARESLHARITFRAK
jgi:hypothetical protein